MSELLERVRKHANLNKDQYERARDLILNKTLSTGNAALKCGLSYTYLSLYMRDLDPNYVPKNLGYVKYSKCNTPSDVYG
jgi:hypothetical protein